jgi:hypothetical protein
MKRQSFGWIDVRIIGESRIEEAISTGMSGCRKGPLSW